MNPAIRTATRTAAALGALAAVVFEILAARGFSVFALLVAVSMLAASCEKASTGGPPLREVTTPLFGQMRWLVGTWRGVGLHGGTEVGAPFYETWRAVDDSTFVMHRFDDSARTRARDSARDSARVELRGGRVYYRSSKPLMMATGLGARDCAVPHECRHVDRERALLVECTLADGPCLAWP